MLPYADNLKHYLSIFADIANSSCLDCIIYQLERSKLHIVYTWLVLICFIAGQLMVFAHQHRTNGVVNNLIKTTQNPDQKIITEKCQLCDAMHHNEMVLTHHSYFTPAVAVKHVYIHGDYNFISIALILSAGRSPPSFS